MSRNHLADETSPYLLQHKDNPVNWFPWSPQAFELASKTNRPVLLSIGYAACHWCHVMAHESFEDPETANVMNELFVNIKVDREERPDIDKIYMDAIHSLGEQGGWPLTIFLTPEAKPFWGGTYFPKTPQYGRPSFTQVLKEISRIWHTEYQKIETNTQAIQEALERRSKQQTTAQLTDQSVILAANTIAKAIDFQNGGLQGAPKFPQCSIFAFLWQVHDREPAGHLTRAVETTLTHICQGGIYDHIGGGFARYSVDARWLVPHFEKMLYDNAQLVVLMADVAVRTGNTLFRTRIDETIDWLKREMHAPNGAFTASYDADSEGVEGKFYVWSKHEVEDLLDKQRAPAFCAAYDITEVGNWEGQNIPNRLHHLELYDQEEEQALAEDRKVLFSERQQRIPPGWDDKVLADWNGLAIQALARAGMLLDQHDWVDTAEAAFAAVIDVLWRDNTLFQTHRAGRTQHHATADGYANLIAACIALFSATGSRSYIDQAIELEQAVTETHWNPDQGGYYLSSSKAENLIVRSHYAHDDATPNANATMLRALTDLHLLTDEARFQQSARSIHDAFAGDASRVLMAHAGFIAAFDHFINPVQAVLTGNTDKHNWLNLRQALFTHAPSNLLLIPAASEDSLPENHAAKSSLQDQSQPVLYVCRGQTCSLPVTDPAKVKDLFVDDPQY